MRKEVASIRGGRVGKRIIWPEAIRKMVAGLVADGISISDISKVTGISSATIGLWHHRQFGKAFKSAGFCELGISGVRRGMVVRFRSGTEVAGLEYSHIERLLKPGLLRSTTFFFLQGTFFI